MNKPVLITLTTHDDNNIVLNINHVVYMCPQRLPDKEDLGTFIQLSVSGRHDDGYFLVKDSLEQIGEVYERIGSD